MTKNSSYSVYSLCGFLAILPIFQGKAENPAELQPLMAVADEVVLEEEFSEPGPLDKAHWGARQGTRWAVADGVLRGEPSTPEYQASKPDHKGLEARVSSPLTPDQFIARFSVRFSAGKETSVVPFVEFGHHVARLKFSGEGGLSLLADGETVKLAEAKDFTYEPGKWYHALAEMKGEELVVQFADGPVIYASHPQFAAPPSSGANGLGVAGP